MTNTSCGQRKIALPMFRLLIPLILLLGLIVSGCTQEKPKDTESLPENVIYQSDTVTVTKVPTKIPRSYLMAEWASLSLEKAFTESDVILSGTVSNTSDVKTNYGQQTAYNTLFDLTISKVYYQAEDSLSSGDTITVALGYSSYEFFSGLPVVESGKEFILFGKYSDWSFLSNNPLELKEYTDCIMLYGDNLLIEKVGEHYLAGRVFSPTVPQGCHIKSFAAELYPDAYDILAERTQSGKVEDDLDLLYPYLVDEALMDAIIQAHASTSYETPATPADHDLITYYQDYFTSNKWPNQILSVPFSSAQTLSLYDLFHDGIQNQYHAVSGDELDFLVSEGFEPAMDIQKMPVQDMENVLQKYFGISLAEANRIGLEFMTYYEETDCYYTNHNGSNRLGSHFLVSNVVESADQIQVYYTTYPGSEISNDLVITMVRDGDDYKFLSNLPV